MFWWEKYLIIIIREWLGEWKYYRNQHYNYGLCWNLDLKGFSDFFSCFMPENIHKSTFQVKIWVHTTMIVTWKVNFHIFFHLLSLFFNIFLIKTLQKIPNYFLHISIILSTVFRSIIKCLFLYGNFTSSRNLSFTLLLEETP